MNSARLAQSVERTTHSWRKAALTWLLQCMNLHVFNLIDERAQGNTLYFCSSQFRPCLIKGESQTIPFSMHVSTGILKIDYEDGHVLNAKFVPKSRKKSGHFEHKTCTRNT